MQLAMTAGEFQATAIAWLTAISLVIGAIAAAVVVAAPKVVAAISAVAAIKQSTASNAQRLDDHSRRISGVSSNLTTLAMEVEPNNKPEGNSNEIHT